jgi:hypothetical protein
MAGTSKPPVELGPPAGPYGRDSIPTRRPRQSFRRDCGGRPGANAVTSTKRLDARLVFGLPMIPAIEKERQRATGPFISLALCAARI